MGTKKKSVRLINTLVRITVLGIGRAVFGGQACPTKTTGPFRERAWRMKFLGGLVCFD